MNNLVVFVKEAWAELKQVSWLTPAQMIASTWLVIVLCALMAVYIASVDFVLSFILRILV